jgi:hypothetical protein
MPPGRPRKTNQDVLLKSAEMIGWALGGIEREIVQTRERLSALLQQAEALRARAGRGKAPAGASTTAATAPAAGGRKRRRRKLSAEARKRISDNLKKRWADAKKAGKSRLQPAR